MAAATAGRDTRAEIDDLVAAKYGLRALADTLRSEEHHHGVRVTSVYPSRTATPMQQRMHGYEGKPYDPARWIDPRTVAAVVIGALDLPADAEAGDITLRVGQGHKPCPAE